MEKINIFWFRRDLRLHDNAGLYHALKDGSPVVPLFIFDKNILSVLENKTDARVTFIYDTLQYLKKELHSLGSDLEIHYGNPNETWNFLIQKYQIKAVYANDDYESYSHTRDQSVRELLLNNNIPMFTYKDHVIFEKNEVLKKDGKPFTVFTPYKNKWLEKLNSAGSDIVSSNHLQPFDTYQYFKNFLSTNQEMSFPSLDELGFKRSDIPIPSDLVSPLLIKEYDEKRNFPSIAGTSRLGIHFRFGTISIREKVKKAAVLSPTFLSELIWRDFYAMILFHFPQVEKKSFKPRYDNIEWRNDETDFRSWCDGMTGFPIVDSGMRELSATGFMHNRVRMITASFLTKHLLIDWRIGASWFAEKLLDFDLASNNGGWQWVAGSGTDAAPYFRIFSPEAQTKKFDGAHHYIKKWIPELNTSAYPKPIVDDKMARERCLRVYKEGLERK